MSPPALLLPVILIASSSLAAAGGDPDPTFDLRPDGPTTGVAQMADGLIFIGGQFDNIGTEPRGTIARIHPDGTLDGVPFPGTNGNANCITVMEDGSVILGGSFSTVGATTRRRLVRLTANGGVDAVFNPNPAKPEPKEQAPRSGEGQ